MKLQNTRDILLHLLDELPEAEALELRAELELLFSRVPPRYDSGAGKIRLRTKASPVVIKGYGE